MTAESKYLANPGFVMREIAGEILLVPVGEQTKKLNGFVTFTETGAFIWKALDGKRTAADIAALLAKEYDTQSEDVLADVLEFLTGAEKRGLVLRA